VLAIFTWLVTRTPLGRAMRACEQDRKMAGLLGIDTDRTISLTFVIGAPSPRWRAPCTCCATA
jgi:branched-chain amino acid transport system permease protein